MISHEQPEADWAYTRYKDDKCEIKVSYCDHKHAAKQLGLFVAVMETGWCEDER